MMKNIHLNGIGVLLGSIFDAGAFQLGKTVVDLTEQYNFVPAVSVDDYLKINRNRFLSDSGGRRYRNFMRVRTKPQADLLKGMVLCGFCGLPYPSGLTTKQGKRIYYYRCDNPLCEKHNKSERAKVVVTRAYEVLKNIKIMAKKDVYEHYRDAMVNIVTKKNKELEAMRKGLQLAKIKEEKRIEKDIREHYLKR